MNLTAKSKVVLTVALLGALAAMALVWTVPSAEAQSAPKRTVWGLTTMDRLINVSPKAPGKTLSNKPITGIGNDTLIGMDFRPEIGRLFAVGKSGSVYMIKTNTAKANKVNQITVPLQGSRFGVDFNPAADALRIVSNTGQNLRIGTGGKGETFTDTPLVYADGDENTGPVPAVGAAYTNNVFDATTTSLYYIDAENDVLAEVAEGGTANTGPVATVGELGVDTDRIVGFDIAPGYDNLVSLKPMGKRTALYSIDLETGDLDRIGVIGTGGNVKDIALQLQAPPAN